MHTHKKIIVFVLALNFAGLMFVMFSFISPVASRNVLGVNAPSDLKLNLELKPYPVDHAYEITAKVKAKSTANISVSNYSIKMDYDPNKLELIKVDYLLSKDSFTKEPNLLVKSNNNGYVVLNAHEDFGTPVTISNADTDIVNLTFKSLRPDLKVNLDMSSIYFKEIKPDGSNEIIKAK